MSFIILFSGILLLVLLIAWLKLNAFLAFLVVSLGIGLANGQSIQAVTASVQSGMGDILGSLLVILVLGAMLGKLIADYGAAQRIASGLMNVFGKKISCVGARAYFIHRRHPAFLRDRVCADGAADHHHLLQV